MSYHQILYKEAQRINSAYH